MIYSHHSFLTVTTDQLKESAIYLVCNGLDTIVTVYVNGQKVGSAENMFVRYKYNIKSSLKVISELRVY